MPSRNPRWIIPLESGEIRPGRPCVFVECTDVFEVIAYGDGPGRPSFPALSPLVACQLGQALLEASKWCWQESAKRQARKR